MDELFDSGIKAWRTKKAAPRLPAEMSSDDRRSDDVFPDGEKKHGLSDQYVERV